MKRRSDWLPLYEDLWEHHRGNTRTAAILLGMTQEALERAIYRARKDGVTIRTSGVRR